MRSAGERPVTGRQTAELLTEWAALHAAGIVPQAPPRAAR